jgi:hypothetical protein
MALEKRSSMDRFSVDSIGKALETEIQKKYSG